MQIMFSKKELKYLEVYKSDSYAIRAKDTAPPDIKKSITEKIEAHKRWLSRERRKD